MPEPFGFLNVNKPRGLTSHDVVAQMRREIRPAKVGHAGTLDPMATGVLILCVGLATRLSDFVMHGVKRYRAQICLGVETDTYDAEGQIVARTGVSGVNRQDIEHALNGFLGQIEQIPPMHSAIKVGGHKLYDLARKGISIERKPRTITIVDIQMLNWAPPLITIDITCGAGTYIRSLAHDLGVVVGIGAHLSVLTRLSSGRFLLENALAIETLRSGRWKDHLVSPKVALMDWPAVTLNCEAVKAVRAGRSVTCLEEAQATTYMAYDDRGQLVAVGQLSDGLFRPRKVFFPPDTPSVAT